MSAIALTHVPADALARFTEEERDFTLRMTRGVARLCGREDWADPEYYYHGREIHHEEGYPNATWSVRFSRSQGRGFTMHFVTMSAAREHLAQGRAQGRTDHE